MCNLKKINSNKLKILNSLMKKSLLYAFYFMAQIEMLLFTFDCNLPNNCFIQPQKYDVNQYNYEKDLINVDFKAIKCKITKEFRFRFTKNHFMKNESSFCEVNNNRTKTEDFIFEWPKKHELILDNRFDMENMMSYFLYFKWNVVIEFVNLRGVEINLNSSLMENNPSVSIVYCISCKLNFYTNGKLIKSCRDILASNSTVTSIFQIKLNDMKTFGIYNSDFPTDLCPLVFKNANIESLYLLGLTETFYKKSTLKFSIDVFYNLNSTIYQIVLEKVENINLDLTILNPSVFSELQEIQIIGAVKTIDKTIFTTLNQLNIINFSSAHFRKIVHKNGIDWIIEINKNL